MDKNEFCDYLLGHVGSRYWLGCYGQIATKTLWDHKSIVYPWPFFSFYSQLRFEKEKNFFRERIEVFDSTGLILSYFFRKSDNAKVKYNEMYHFSIDGLKNICLAQPIKTKPCAGDVLFKTKNNGKIGVFVGGSSVVLCEPRFGVHKIEYFKSDWEAKGDLFLFEKSSFDEKYFAKKVAIGDTVSSLSKKFFHDDAHYYRILIKKGEEFYSRCDKHTELIPGSYIFVERKFLK